MTIEWDGYRPYDPGIVGPPNELPRAQARQAFERCMETKPERLEMLGRLLKANGVALGASDAAVQDLNDWFLAHVEADPRQPGWLLPDWYSVLHDVPRQNRPRSPETSHSAAGHLVVDDDAVTA